MSLGRRLRREHPETPIVPKSGTTAADNATRPAGMLADFRRAFAESEKRRPFAGPWSHTSEPRKGSASPASRKFNGRRAVAHRTEGYFLVGSSARLAFGRPRRITGGLPARSNAPG